MYELMTLQNFIQRSGHTQRRDRDFQKYFIHHSSQTEPLVLLWGICHEPHRTTLVVYNTYFMNGLLVRSSKYLTRKLVRYLLRTVPKHDSTKPLRFQPRCLKIMAVEMLLKERKMILWSLWCRRCNGNEWWMTIFDSFEFKDSPTVRDEEDQPTAGVVFRPFGWAATGDNWQKVSQRKHPRWESPDILFPDPIKSWWGKNRNTRFRTEETTCTKHHFRITAKHVEKNN